MPYVKINSYRYMPFSEETAKGDFYTFYNVPDLFARIELNKEEAICCRTVGILHSLHGRFYISDVSSPSLNCEEPMIQVSMVYLSTPPQSTVMPYPVQVFGLLKWKKRPVIITRILQVLTTSTALQLRDTLNAVTSIHLASSVLHVDNNSDEIDDLFYDSFNLNQ